MKTIPKKSSLAATLLFAAVCLPAPASAFSLRTISSDHLSSVTAAPGLTAEYEVERMYQLEGSGAASQSKAVWYSLLVPGLGDYYLGNTTRAKGFFIAEAAIWTSFIVFEAQGHLREGGYKDFAMTFGGVTGSGHSDDYYRILSQYNSSDEYEEAIKKEGRFVLYPDAGYNALDDFYLSERISDFEPWQWPSDELRWEYRAIRKGSRQAYRRAMYSVAAAVANRVVSSLFALKSARDLRRGDQASTGSYHIQFGHPSMDIQDPLRTGLTFVRTF
ncbi:MAG: hypothetical protein ABIA59_06065 [Candidatus Latescibacterota bacterium]